MSERPELQRCFASIRFDSVGPPTVATPEPRSLATTLWTSDDAQTAAPARAFEYSDGYHTRAEIHRMASWAMLPLFVTEAVIPQKMFNDPSTATSGMRTAHRAFGISIGGLFAVSSVTGVMNLAESRKDPNAGVRSLVHGVLMLVADAGFVATAMTRPKSGTSADLAIYDAKENQHMALAYASVSVATVRRELPDHAVQVGPPGPSYLMSCRLSFLVGFLPPGAMPK